MSKCNSTLTILLLIYLSRGIFACPTRSVFTQNRIHGIETFTIDTAIECSRHPSGETSIPVCYVDSLTSLMTYAERVLGEAVFYLVNTTGLQNLCNNSPNEHSGYPSGQGMADTLKNGIELMSEVALNMTIINCHHPNAMMPPRTNNVHQPVQDIVCEMKKLMRFVQIDPSKYRSSISQETMGMTDMLEFTCQNLHRAISFIRHLKHDINNAFENMA